jgi:diguanylate cyclase (GGDEF)-like protein/PAS domain S-box-containing protein
MGTAIAVHDSQREAARLEALDRFGILDTAREREFDDVAALAAHVCGAPMAAVTFIDRTRQWFKASVGLGMRETPREVAFCAWTVESAQPFIVPDARDDVRFAGNPYVTGAPHLRFYAGVPLIARDGNAVGALAVMDTVPRTLTAAQHRGLQVLADQVAALLDVRLALRRVRQDHEALQSASAALREQVDARTSDLRLASGRIARLERLHGALWQHTSDAVLILDAGNIIRYANPATERLFGHPVATLEGGPLARIQPERLRASHAQGMRAYLASGQRMVAWRARAVPALHADGHEIPVEIALSELELDGERLFVGLVRDVSERARAAAALDRERERAQGTLRCLAEGVVTIDAAARVLTLNPMAEQLTGWTQARAVGEAVERVIRLMHEDDATGIPLPLPAAGLGGPDALPLPAKAVLQAHDGRTASVEGSVAVLAGAEAGAPAHAGWVIALRDVSRARSLAAQIEYQATHDALTGLVNRTEFDRCLRRAHEAAATRGQPSSLLYIDLDRFKIVNDSCGHIAGDALLRDVASVLRTALRSSDTLARLGGDEFGALLENCPPERALQIAGAMRDLVADFAFVWDRQLFRIGASIGHVPFRDGNYAPGELLGRADEACYVAKDAGRDRVHTHEPGEATQARRRGEMRWAREIDQALDEDRFVLFAQPIYPVNDPRSAPMHHEVLLRLRDRDGTLVPPMAFIPAAERYRLMTRLDRWVIRRTLATLAQVHDAQGLGEATFAINLSGATLGDEALAEFIENELRTSGVPGACIGFEITETAAIANFTHAVRLIEAIRALGCRFSLDDFGSGLSSFAYLRHLPVDCLKIDGSFVRTIATSAVDRAMVASINEIGHLMGLRTIAEFVEDDATLAQLRALGVDYAQGYGLRRPAPLADVLGELTGAARPIAIDAAACVQAQEPAADVECVSGPAEAACAVEAEQAI